MRIVNRMNLAMINMQLLMTFAITTAVIIVIPGPSVMFIVGRALSVGRPAALAAAAGNTLGSTFQGVLAALGLGTVISGSPFLYNVIKMSGALYLVMMGARTLRDRGVPAEADAAASDGQREEARKGFIVGATNPKTMVFRCSASSVRRPDSRPRSRADAGALGDLFSALADWRHLMGVRRRLATHMGRHIAPPHRVVHRSRRHLHHRPRSRPRTSPPLARSS
jgi:threonine/homoserine/homoserine lactone efflux protein